MGNSSGNGTDFDDLTPDAFLDTVTRYFDENGWRTKVYEVTTSASLVACARSGDTDRPERTLCLVETDPDTKVSTDHVEYVLKQARRKDISTTSIVSRGEFTAKARTAMDEYGVDHVDLETLDRYRSDFSPHADEFELPDPDEPGDARDGTTGLPEGTATPDETTGTGSGPVEEPPNRDPARTAEFSAPSGTANRAEPNPAPHSDNTRSSPPAADGNAPPSEATRSHRSTREPSTRPAGEHSEAVTNRGSDSNATLVTTRRAALVGLLGVGGVVGFTALDRGVLPWSGPEDGPDDDPGVGGPDTATPPVGRTPTSSPVASPEPTPAPTPTQRPTPTPEPTPQPPGSDLVVAADGSGDYDSLDLGLEATSEDEESVIELRPGEYEASLSKARTVLRGAGRDETTVRLLGSKLPFDVQFWDVTVRAPETGTFETHYNGAVRFFHSLAECGFSVGRGGVISLFDSEVTASVATERFRATNSRFQDLSIGVYERTSTPTRIVDSRAAGTVTISGTTQFSTHEIRNTVIEGSLALSVPYPEEFLLVDSEVRGVTFQGDYDKERSPPRVRNSTITANDEIGAAVHVNGDDNLVDTRVDIRGSELTTAGADTDTAVKASGGNGLTLVDNLVEGVVRGASDSGLFRWNTFRSPNSDGTTWFVDGRSVPRIVGNAFVGGDIRLDDDRVTVYDIDRKLGNYYAAYDGSDDDGDGLYDESRTLPGEAELVDEFPLASEDLSQYRD